MSKCSWKGLLVTFVVIFVLGTVLSGVSEAKQYKFVVSQGWLENDSGQKHRKGFQDAFKDFGDTEVTYANANYDPKLQSEQIEAFIKMKPDAMFVTPSDTLAITSAVQRAVEAGIPVFSGDSLVAGAAVTTTIMSNNFGMGVESARFIAKKLGGKGKIGTVVLPENETWDLRTLGMEWALREYPEIEIVASWVFDSTGQVTARQGVENMLTANPNKGDLDAVWCAWDGAAMEGALAIQADGRTEIFTTGIDGGQQAFEYILETPMALTMAQDMYTMAYQNVVYAHMYLEGKKVPRLVISPVYMISAEELEGKEIRDDYDAPGVATEELGWERKL